MNIAEINLKRTKAMIDFEEGHLPEAENVLTMLIDQLIPPETLYSINQLCQCLSDRATVRSIAHRWDDALKDLSDCEQMANSLSDWNRKERLVNIYHMRAKIFGTPFANVHDDQASLKWVGELRHLSGTSPWMIDELEGGIAFQKQEWAYAATLYEGVAQAVGELGWARAAASCRLRVGLAQLEMGNQPLARSEITFAHNFFHELGPPDQLAAAQMALARVESASPNHDVAWELAKTSLTGVEGLIRHFRALFEQQRFIADKLKYYQEAFAVGLAKGGTEGLLRAWTIAERAKSFYLCQLIANADIPLFDGIDRTQIAELRELETRIDDYESKLQRLENQADKDALLQDIERISKERHTLLESMMRANPRWGVLKTPPVFDLEVELQRLDPTWIPVSYFWQTQNDGAVLHIFYTEKDRKPCHLSNVWSQTELDQLDENRAKLRSQVSSLTPLFPNALIERVLPPAMVNEWKNGQHILISPHDRLRALPLHALRVTGQKLLIDLCPVKYIPTLALLTSHNPSPYPDKVLLMGCEQDGFGDKPLKYVPVEINDLNTIWSKSHADKTTCGLVEASDSPTEMGLGPENWEDYAFIHIACHGIFPEGKPFDAALRLGKEAVRASEFFTVRLRAALVSLSACSLGGQARRYSNIDLVGDEWIGMYLPLFYAGAQTLLVSLWDADSISAADFMKALHTALSIGTPIAETFKQATQSVKHKPTKCWANWYLVGFPDVTTVH